MPIDQGRGRNLERTTEDIAQDKRLATLSNKIDDIHVTLDALTTAIAELRKLQGDAIASIKPLQPIADAIKRIDEAIADL